MNSPKAIEQLRSSGFSITLHYWTLSSHFLYYDKWAAIRSESYWNSSNISFRITKVLPKDAELFSRVIIYILKHFITIQEAIKTSNEDERKKLMSPLMAVMAARKLRHRKRLDISWNYSKRSGRLLAEKLISASLCCHPRKSWWIRVSLEGSPKDDY